MTNLLNIIVLIFEVLYYSLFMKFARKEGKFWRYILLFIICTLFILIFNSNNLLTYLGFVLITLFGLKYICKMETSLYDMLVIIIMLFTKIIIETPLFMVFSFIPNRYMISIVTSIIKILIIYLLRNKLEKYYNKLKIMWDNNNFYIRYIFSIFMFIYCIITIMLLIYF